MQLIADSIMQEMRRPSRRGVSRNGCVVDAAEALLELFDVVNGIFGIETDSVCELSRVCQNTTSLYDEIAAPGRAAISYLGSIRLAT